MPLQATTLLPRRISGSFTARRVARRLGWRPARVRVEAPRRPVGAKFELTHACNLRCGFCYTDSPRHTLQRTPDLSDDAWLDIADQAVELGVIEVVLTGGEPFLRRELVFALLERLSRRDLGLTLNTNGWFVDDAAADRLARVRGLQVDVSIDGATPTLHDTARGVPGSWRRAVAATSRLLDRGVRVQVVHVVTPDNQRGVPAFLDRMWTLGVTSVRLTPVLEIGAAARSGDWEVNRARLGREIRRFHRSYGDDMRVLLQPGEAGVLAINDLAAPAALLVRPSGTVLTDSLHPFAFGHALEDGLEACWARIADGWRDPRISKWAGSMRSVRDLPRSEVIPYLDEEVPVAPASARPDGGEASPQRHAADPVPGKSKPRDGPADPEEQLAWASDYVRGLAMKRRYRMGSIRIGGGPRDLYVRTASGSVARLNGTAALLVHALNGGTPAEAIDQLAERFSGTDRARLEQDVLAAARLLAQREILVPALAAKSSVPQAVGGTDASVGLAG